MSFTIIYLCNVFREALYHHITRNVTPTTRAYRKSTQHDPRDDKFREAATRGNTRNMTEYRVSAKCINDLANADAEIGVRVFKKTSLTILLKITNSSQHEKSAWNKNPR
jgi:hypothetical protein